MLLQHFGFREDPFGATPDPRCFYHSPTHDEALASLKYGIFSNRGFVALIAPPGMGKTTLLFRFLDGMRDTARSVFLFDVDPQCEPRDLLGYILRDVGITPGQDSAERHDQLKEVLTSEAKSGRQFVLVIDEAQNLSDGALEMVRVLTNFETSRSKLMQIVLSGQPQLSDKLLKPSLVQLRQRISTFCKIEPLSDKETEAYISHRLATAGYDGPALFTPEALTRIVETSHGVPRIINNLCFNSLSLCFALKRKQVDGGMVAEVIADQQLSPSPQAAQAVEIQLPSFLQPQKRSWVPLTAIPLGVIAASLFILFLPGALTTFGSKIPADRQSGNERSLDAEAMARPAATHEAANVAKPLTDDANSGIPQFAITVVPHQCLRDISMQYFGDFNRDLVHQIQQLNPTLVNPDHIEAGQTLWLPKLQPTPVAVNATSPATVRNVP